MTGQNFQLNLMSIQPGITQEIKKPDVSKGNYSKFNDVLSSTINKTPTNNHNSKKLSESAAKNNAEVKNPDQQSKFKAFNEIKQNKKPETKASETVSGKDTAEVDSLANKKEVKETTPGDNVAVEALAQVMGIPVQDLIKVLSSLNIKPEDLTDTTKSQEVVDKLSNLMNLNDSQKQTLVDIFKTLKEMVIEKVDQNSKHIPESKEQNKNTLETSKANVSDSKNADWVKLDNSNISVVKQQDLTEVLAKFKANIEQLTQKLQQNPEQAISDIATQIKGAIFASEVKSSSENPGVAKVTETEKTTDVEAKASTEEVKEVVDGKQDKADSKNQNEAKNNQSGESKIVAPQVLQSTNVKVDDSSTLQLNNQMPSQVQKTDDLGMVAKVQKEVPVTKNEIINQVVEKAKVTLTGDKSEMSMDLKPDNLGKLALKVVTERGIVVAKFVAESQQVKETLEANMQLLKDSLEKQGLSVQNVSVSVQQDPYKGRSQQFESDNNKKQASGNNELSSIGTINASDLLETQKRINAYNWSNSSINLTA